MLISPAAYQRVLGLPYLRVCHLKAAAGSEPLTSSSYSSGGTELPFKIKLLTPPQTRSSYSLQLFLGPTLPAPNQAQNLPYPLPLAGTDPNIL